MNLSQIAHHYYRMVYAILAVLMIMGFVAYFTLSAKEDPSITIREAVITTNFPGMPADRVELLITKTLEEAIRSVSELEEIRSVSMQGQSIIHAEAYDRFFDLDQIWDEVRNEVEDATAQLPEGTQTPIINDDFGDVAVLTVALMAEDGFDMGAMFDQAQHIRDTMYGVDGTKRVDILGVQDERIYIEIVNAKLAQLGISPDELISILQNQNIIRPGGAIDADGKSFVIEPTGNFDSVEAIRDLLIPLPGTQESIAVRDIAVIERGFIDPPNRTAYFNGEEAIIFAISMADNFNVLEYTPRMVAQIEELQQILPAGYRLEIATKQAVQVENAVYGVTANVLQTLIIVLAVVILFLGVRTGLIVGAIVPAVMLVTLAIMSFTGMTLERMSLATLVIALGLLVDNGIVIAEDFKKRLEEGESRDEALKSTGGTLAIPLLTSSLTTILVFLPLMLAEHVSGEYTRSISLVILITLLVSWVIALTVTPLLCYKFIKNPKTRDDTPKFQQKVTAFFDALNPYYEKTLRRVMRHRVPFLVLMGVLFAIALGGIVTVPKKFFPDSDRTQILIYLDLPAGTSMRKTDATLKEIFKEIENKDRFPHIESFAGYGGFGGPRFVLSLTPIDPEQSKGFIVLNIDELQNSELTMDALRAMFDEKFPAVMARATMMFLGPSDSSKIEIQVKGPDANYIYATADQIKNILRDVPGAIDIKTDWENRITEIKVDVDQQRAKRVGVTSADIAQSLERYFSGEVISELREGDDLVPIIVRAKDSERFDLSRIQTVNVYATGSDVTVPLMQVADIKLENNYARIARENLFRTITIEAKNTMMTAESMVPIVQPELDKLKAGLPPSHEIEYDGVVKDSGDAQGAIQANLPLCLGIVFLLLVAQFNSYRRAFIICLTVPMMMIGASIGLNIMQANFGFMVILGLYALAGIIINNAIVLIDRIDLDRKDIDDDFEAIIAACVRRLRPILMTTVTTILGLMPLIIAADPLFYGMATVIAFGLAVGTILTLGVTPVLYSLFFKINSENKGDKGEIYAHQTA